MFKGNIKNVSFFFEEICQLSITSNFKKLSKIWPTLLLSNLFTWHMTNQTSMSEIVTRLSWIEVNLNYPFLNFIRVNYLEKCKKVTKEDHNLVLYMLRESLKSSLYIKIWS